MDVFFFVILIVTIGCGTGVISNYLKAKSKGTSKEIIARIEALEDRLNTESSLEERVQALETIVTDNRHHLDREIRAL